MTIKTPKNQSDFELGQKAERERVLGMIEKLLKIKQGALEVGKRHIKTKKKRYIKQQIARTNNALQLEIEK